MVSFCQANSNHHKGDLNSLEAKSSHKWSPSALSRLNFIGLDEGLNESGLSRKIRSPSSKTSKWDEFKIIEISSTSKKPKTTQKTARTYKPPRVQNPLQIDDESIEWVESGVTPEWIRTSLEDFRSSIENESNPT